MRRVVIVSLLACALLLALAVPAFATTNYKLTVVTWYDRDGDGIWGVDEPILPGIYVYVSGTERMLRTDCCGWVKYWLPSGVYEVQCYVPGVFPPDPGNGYYMTTPPSVVVDLNRNKCVGFGLSYTSHPYNPPKPVYR